MPKKSSSCLSPLCVKKKKSFAPSNYVKDISDVGFDCWIVVFSFLQRELEQWATLSLVCRGWFLSNKHTKWVSLLRPQCKNTFQLLTALSLTGLQTLDLTSCQGLNEFWLQSLSSLTSLRKLALTGTVISFSSLEFLSKLQVLTLYFFTAEHLSSICSLPRLQHLSLISGNNVSSFRALSHLTTLQNLEVWNCSKLTDEGLKPLLSLSMLQKLAISKCPLIGDKSMNMFAAFSMLRTFHILDCSLITDAGILALTSLTKLQELVIRGCPSITDAGIRQMSYVPRLVIKGHACIL